MGRNPVARPEGLPLSRGAERLDPEAPERDEDRRQGTTQERGNRACPTRVSSRIGSGGVSHHRRAHRLRTAAEDEEAYYRAQEAQTAELVTEPLEPSRNWERFSSQN